MSYLNPGSNLGINRRNNYYQFTCRKCDRIETRDGPIGIVKVWMRHEHCPISQKEIIHFSKRAIKKLDQKAIEKLIEDLDRDYLY